jgi:hypothetical protein
MHCERPTREGFLKFLRCLVGIPTTALPDCSEAVTAAFCNALEIVNLQISQASPLLYREAVYNLATDYLITWAPDYQGSKFFAELRGKDGYNITAFTAGVIQATADEGTSESMLVPDFFKQLTLADLQNLKTPYGRAYLAIAQRAGTLWGLS